MSLASADDAQFRTFFEAHFADLWRFARRRSSSSADADDITAETFAVAWRRRHELPASDELRLWLFGVSRLVLANHQRSLQRQQRLEVRLADNYRLDRGHEPEPLTGQLRSALDALSDDERTVLLMRSWDGLAVADIARVLGVTPNAVSIRLHRARQRMASHLPAKDPSTAGHVKPDPQPRTEEGHAN